MFRIPVLIAVLTITIPASASVCTSTSSTIPDIKLDLIAADLDAPVTITHAGDGSERLFIVEQAGRIRVIKNNKLIPDIFLDIRKRVADGGERGLLGLAFHPRFKDNGKFYVNYTTDQDGLTTRVSEFRINKDGAGNSNSEKVLLSFKQPWGNHNGGQLAFAADGYLYIAIGDGGAGDDPNNNGQNLNTVLGKILRIDVNRSGNNKAYGIPRDNPFVGKKKSRPEIWAYGLRNPWRFSFDRLTGELYAADVGQDEIEEIDIIKKGRNYGWRVMEGPICTPGVNPNCKKTGFELPVYSYDHDVGRSITGGYVYRGKKYPSLCGVYLYGDFVSQAIWGIRVKKEKVITHKTLFEAKSMLYLALDYFRDSGLLISTFGEDEDGEVYVAAYQSGRIYRIEVK